MEERERLERESKKQSPVLIQKNINSSKVTIISESSESDEDRKIVKNCLRLNRRPAKALVEKDETMHTSTEEINHCSSEHSISDSVSLNETKEERNRLAGAAPRNWRNKHLQSPKRDVHNNKQQKNNRISDSDTDDSQTGYGYKESPKAKWTGPDIRLNLKDLGLNKHLGSWIELSQGKPVMSTIPVRCYSFNMIGGQL